MHELQRPVAPEGYAYVYSWFAPIGGLQEMTSYSSDAQVIDLLCMWAAFLRPRVIVEAGTYRGHTAIAIGEILRRLDIPGCVYTADPEDYGIMERGVNPLELQCYVRYWKGSYDDMLQEISEPVDLAYIDASASDDPGMRLRHVRATKKRLSKRGLIFVDDVAGKTPGMKEIRQMASLYFNGGRGLAVLQR